MSRLLLSLLTNAVRRMDLQVFGCRLWLRIGVRYLLWPSYRHPEDSESDLSTPILAMSQIVTDTIEPEAPFSWRKKVIARDGFRCVITKLPDGALRAQLAGRERRFTFLHTVHILRRSLVDPSGVIPELDLPQTYKVHWFDLDFQTVERIPTETLSFTNHAPHNWASISLPNSKFIASHAARACVLHFSGAGGMFDKILDEFDDLSEKKLPSGPVRTRDLGGMDLPSMLSVLSLAQNTLSKWDSKQQQ